MDKTGWTRINELFELARRLPIDERPAFVRASTTDEEIRSEVLQLLREHEDDPWAVEDYVAPPTIEHAPAPPASGHGPAVPAPGTGAAAATSSSSGRPSPASTPAPAAASRAAAAGAAASPATPAAGVPVGRPTPSPRRRSGEVPGRPAETTAASTRYGDCHIIREIGRGAMGTVFDAAFRQDGHQERVTLRVLPRDWQTVVGAEWFRAACRLVAGLDHPAITRLVDFGVADDGSRFVATAHVTGEEIDAWCRAQDLNVEGRVHLVLDVCAALEYAHQRLVVHRSVCPANIVVTPAGRPKLLNCGVARLLFGRPDAGEALERTGQSLFTPEYASPEQVNGDLMTTSSDVYSVGVLLYVLLTDRPPYDLRDLQPDEMKRTICREQPDLPSRAAPAARRRALAKELDAIVMRALQKDPGARYVSVTALASDLRAWLDGGSVSAVTSTRLRSAVRLMRRHRPGAAVVGAVALGLVTLTAVSSWQNSVLRSEKARAEAALGEAHRASQGLVSDLLGTVAAVPRTSQDRRDRLGRLADHLDALAGDGGGDRTIAIGLVQAYRRLAGIQADTPGDAPAGAKAAAASLDAAIAAGERALAAEPGSVEAAAALTGAWGDLASARLALGERAAADRADARHRELVETLSRDFPGPRARAAAASGYARLGAYRLGAGDRAGARMVLTSAAAGFDGLTADGQLPADARRDYSRVLRQLASILLEDGSVSEAERRYLQAQAIDRADAARQPKDASLRLDLVDTTAGLASVARRRGDNPRAETLWAEALAAAQSAAAADGTDTRALERLAELRESLAALRRGQRRFDEALGYARDALRAREPLAAASGAPPGAAIALAAARLAVARLQLDVCEVRPAEATRDGRIREARAMLALATPVVRDSPSSTPAQREALAEVGRQEARLRRFTLARPTVATPPGTP